MEASGEVVEIGDSALRRYRVFRLYEEAIIVAIWDAGLGKTLDFAKGTTAHPSGPLSCLR